MVGRATSYGIYSHPDVHISAYVQERLSQTKNTAELLALQISTFRRWPFARTVNMFT